METITIDDDFTVNVKEEVGEENPGMESVENGLKWDLEDFSEYSYNNINIKEEIDFENNYIFLSQFKSLEEIKQELEEEIKNEFDQEIKKELEQGIKKELEQDIDEQKTLEYEANISEISVTSESEETKQSIQKCTKIDDNKNSTILENINHLEISQFSDKKQTEKHEDIKQVETPKLSDKKQTDWHETLQANRTSKKYKVEKQEPFDERKTVHKFQKFHHHFRRHRPLRNSFFRSQPYRPLKHHNVKNRYQPYSQNYTDCQIPQKELMDLQTYLILVAFFKELVQIQMQNSILKHIPKVPSSFNTGVSLNRCIQQDCYFQNMHQTPVWANTALSSGGFQQQPQHSLETIQMVTSLVNYLNNLIKY